MVHQWNQAFGINEPEFIDITDEEVNALVVSLLDEEVNELREALLEKNHVKVLDALTDIQYVLDGAYLRLGYSPQLKDLAFAEVQRSNMSKLGEDGQPIRREDGKILKGPNYTPPDLEKVISEYIKTID